MLWLLALIILLAVLCYYRASIHWATLAVGVLLAAYLVVYGASSSSNLSLWMTYLIVFIPLNVIPLRQQLISRWIFKLMKSALPTMSQTEREALEAGNTWWDAELFSG